ncbi:MAG: alpha/beta hydrolase [Ornithinimicrobium sp.]
MNTTTSSHTLTRPEGAIVYDLHGEGPLVVLVPGMGDLRATYRFLVPVLAEAGYQVAVTDLRGHGDSDTTFSSYGDAETASDVVALIEALGGPAVVIGNSMGAAAAAYAAAERPDLVRGLVLMGPFLRDTSTATQRVLLRVAMARPWVAGVWKRYLLTLYAGRPAVDQDAYLADVAAAMKKPGHAKAFALLVKNLDHGVVRERLSAVQAPSLVVMGELDPDFPDPAAEAQWIHQKIGAQVVMVSEAGHYPQSQRPDAVAPAVLDFLAEVDGVA